MNTHLLDEKLKKIQQNLNEESIKLNQITQNLNEAQKYHIDNEKYKQLISQFSIQYLELCEWYVGPELPKPIYQTYLDSEEDINSLYFLFMMSLFLK